MDQLDKTSDDAWLSLVFQKLKVPLVAYATQLLGDRDRARDVVQDAFVQLCKRPRQETEGAEKAWLYRVCRNRAIDILKKEGRMKTIDEAQIGTQESRDGDPREVLAQRDSANHASSLLDNLPDDQREVIRLKVEGELSYREISELTGLSVSNVGYLLHTGLKEIRSHLATSD